MNEKRIIAGNWKMNLSFPEAIELVEKLKTCEIPEDTGVILGVPYPYLHEIKKMTRSYPRIRISAQNCHQELKGAYTGEVSALMLASIGVDGVILGHSERRMYFHEDNTLLLQKLHAALSFGLHPIFCCGEPLDIRQAEKHEEYVANQLQKCIFQLDEELFRDCMIAYEPIWAIGTGETATPEQAQSMHRFIRNLIDRRYGTEMANLTRILYGGSVKPGNAAALFALPDVDGGLVGGASLQADDFCAIIQASSVHE